MYSHQVESTSDIIIGGRQGHNKGELNHPCGVAIDCHSNNVLYVSEWENHRITVFTQDGDFIRCFGTKGTGPGGFDCPVDIAIDKDGKMYVADFGNNRIQIF